MWEDIRRRHDDDVENVRLCWRCDFSVKEFVEATRVLCLCRVAAGTPSIRVNLNVWRPPCVACAPVPVCSERPETPQNPVLLNARAPQQLFFLFTNIFRLEVFEYGRSAENKTTVESDCLHA